MKPEQGKVTLNELAALFPQPRTVTIAGKSVDIVPSTIRAGARVLHLAVQLYALRQSDEDDELMLADDHPEETAALLFAATGLDPDWLASLSATDKVELALVWMEVNGAFFVLRPFLLRLRMGQSVAAMFGGGLMSSHGSNGAESPILADSRPTPRKRGSVQ